MSARGFVAETVPAGSIRDSDCFRKRQGTYVYLRISESSARFAKLDDRYVWGVCFNGNLVHVTPDTRVVPMDLADLQANAADEALRRGGGPPDETA